MVPHDPGGYADAMDDYGGEIADREAQGSLPWPAPTGPMSRASDPDTSKAAPPSVAVITGLQAQILDTYRNASPHGFTDDELARVYFPDRVPGSVIKRRAELVAAGYLVDTGSRRPVVRSGRMAVVWGLAR